MASFDCAHYTELSQRCVHMSLEHWVCRSKPSLPPWVISVLSGAVGECIGQVVLYPLDTIKVLCQKNSCGTLSTLVRLFKSRGPMGALATLYQGVPLLVAATFQCLSIQRRSSWSLQWPSSAPGMYPCAQHESCLPQIHVSCFYELLGTLYVDILVVFLSDVHVCLLFQR
jgi:hypothetical protein